MGITRYHLVIDGRVQGVGYRMSAQIAAQNIALTGWVRNLPTGQVEVVAEGQLEQLDQFVKWAWQGPQFTEVHNIELTQQSATAEFTHFDIR